MSLLGRAALLLALVAAVYALVMALGSRRPGRRAWQESAERGVYAVFALTTLAIGTMWAALLTDDFELRNVAEYTSSTLGAAVQDHRPLGQPGRLAAAVGLDLQRLRLDRRSTPTATATAS